MSVSQATCGYWSEMAKKTKKNLNFGFFVNFLRFLLLYRRKTRLGSNWIVSVSSAAKISFLLCIFIEVQNRWRRDGMQAAQFEARLGEELITTAGSQLCFSREAFESLNLERKADSWWLSSGWRVAKAISQHAIIKHPQRNFALRDPKVDKEWWTKPYHDVTIFFVLQPLGRNFTPPCRKAVFYPPTFFT